MNLLDLANDQCKYPKEDGNYCGCQVKKNSPYCEEHHKICYLPKSKGRLRIGPGIYPDTSPELYDPELETLYILLR